MNERTEKDVDQLVERTQKLVTEYYTVNTEVTRLKGDVDARLGSFAQELKHLSERIPEKLNETLIMLSLKLDGLVASVKQIADDLKLDYVGRTEFEILKVEHDQIKKLMWGFIAMVLTAFVGGLLAFFFKG